MNEFVELKDALWPNRADRGEPRNGGSPATPERRDGYMLGMGQAAYHLDRMPFHRRLALAVLILTWPWRD